MSVYSRPIEKIYPGGGKIEKTHELMITVRAKSRHMYSVPAKLELTETNKM